VAVICLSSLFLLYSAGKARSACALRCCCCDDADLDGPLVRGRVVMMLTPLVLLNLLSVGTAMSEGLAKIAKLLPLDSVSPRSSRYLELCSAIAAWAAGDRLRLRFVLGQQRHGTCRKARNGRPMPPIATTAISIQRWAWALPEA
jgi:hypothetical protein